MYHNAVSFLTASKQSHLNEDNPTVVSKSIFDDRWVVRFY